MRAYVLTETRRAGRGLTVSTFGTVSSKKKAIDGCIVRLIEHSSESEVDDIVWDDQHKHDGAAHITNDHSVSYEMFFVD